MVRELRVEDPNEGKITWEQETEFYHDLVYSGIPLPTRMEEVLSERVSALGLMGVGASSAWDAYSLWLAEQGIDLSEDPHSPRDRLMAYTKS